MRTATSGNGHATGSLTVVGTGIALVGQTTLEAVEHITRAERVFYVVTNPATELWIRRLNSAAISLSDCYATGKPRLVTYKEMTDRILEAVHAGFRVCAAFYGHPGVFVRPSHDAIRRARRSGFPARMLPGISAEDCLFADLGLNPGENGCQSFEATDFLGRRRRFDPATALVLWQVGVIGEGSVKKGMSGRPERLRRLVAMLHKYYPANHSVILYEAAQYPLCQPMIKRKRLDQLASTRIMPMTTLYVPPRPGRSVNSTVARWLSE